MIFLLDTNAVSAVMSADPKVDARLASLDPADRAAPFEPVPVDAADLYARIKSDCEAAGAAALGATLVTRDKDFTRVPGLTTEDWTA